MLETTNITFIFFKKNIGSKCNTVYKKKNSIPPHICQIFDTQTLLADMGGLFVVGSFEQELICGRNVEGNHLNLFDEPNGEIFARKPQQVLDS